MWSYSDLDVFDFNQFLRERDDLLDALQGTLNRLTRNYNTAIKIAKKYPDLQYHLKALEPGLKMAEQRATRVPEPQTPYQQEPTRQGYGY